MSMDDVALSFQLLSEFLLMIVKETPVGNDNERHRNSKGGEDRARA